jgi:hypothetical protein
MYWEHEKIMLGNLYVRQYQITEHQKHYNFYNIIIEDIKLINKKYQHIVEEIVDHIIKYGD